MTLASVGMDLLLPVDPWHAVEELLEAVVATALLATALCSAAPTQVQALAEMKRE